MTVAIETDVKNVLLEFEETILDTIFGAWRDWLSSPHRAQIRFPRTRANLVYDFMVHRAVSVFDANPHVHVIHKDETTKFLFKQKVLLRLKKGDSNSLGSNVKTQAVLAFTDPQATVPGIPDVQKVDIVYILNNLQTEIDQIIVTARDNEIKLWSYEIEDHRIAPVLPLEQPTDPKRGGNVVRLRKRQDDSRRNNKNG